MDPTLGMLAVPGTKPGVAAADYGSAPAPVASRDEVAKWKKVVSRAEQKASDDVKESDKFLELFRHGEFKNNADKVGGKAASINRTFAYVQMMMALTYSQAPEIEVEPREGGDDAAFVFDPLLQQRVGDPGEARRRMAETAELLAKYFHEETKRDEANNAALFLSFVTGLAWSKMAFDPVLGLPTCETLKRTEVYVDPQARYSMRQAGYVIHTATLGIEQAKQFFDTLGVPPQKIQPNWSLGDEPTQSSSSKNDQAGKDQYRFHEIWCRGAGGKHVYYLPYKGEAFLDALSDWPFTLHRDEWPFVPLSFNTQFLNMNDSFTELSTVDALRQMYEETMELYRRQAKRGLGRTVLFDKGVFQDQKQINDIMKSRSLAGFPVDKGEKTWDQLIKVLDWNSQTDPAPAIADQFKMASDEVLGWDELKQGAAQKKLTATQAEILDEYGKLRIGRRQKIIDQWLAQQLKISLQIGRQLIEPETVARVVGQNEALLWSVYAGNAEDFIRSFSIGIQAGSSGERARQQRIQRLQQFLQLAQGINASNAARQSPPTWDEDAIAMDLARANNNRRPEKYRLAPPPPPMPMAVDPATGQPIQQQDPNAMQPGAQPQVSQSIPAGPVQSGQPSVQMPGGQAMAPGFGEAA